MNLFFSKLFDPVSAYSSPINLGTYALISVLYDTTCSLL